MLRLFPDDDCEHTSNDKKVEYFWYCGPAIGSNHCYYVSQHGKPLYVVTDNTYTMQKNSIIILWVMYSEQLITPDFCMWFVTWAISVVYVYRSPVHLL